LKIDVDNAGEACFGLQGILECRAGVLIAVIVAEFEAFRGGIFVNSIF